MIRFGTFGAARITPNALIYPCMNEPRAAVTVIGARDRARAEAFARAHHISTVCDSYAEVIAQPDINAIYNPLPISAHKDWTLAALDAGKHVLCEKSFAMNADEAAEMHQRAVDTGLVVMDAFHYRYHPVFNRVKELVDHGVLGKVKHVDATFHVPVTDPNDIRMMFETGGGVTMDIGCYPLSWVRHLLAAEPETVEATAIVGPPHVDVALNAELTFEGGVTASTSGDMREGVSFKAELKVTGEKGELFVNNPLAPQLGHSIQLNVGGQQTRETLDRRPSYAYQLDAFIDAVENGTRPLTDSDDAVRQMALIDRCYEAAGLPRRGA